MLALDLLAERRIQEAIERGELDDLKNAGFVSPEVEALNEITQLERLVAQGNASAEERSRGARKLSLLKARVEMRYYEKTLRKLTR